MINLKGDIAFLYLKIAFTIFLSFIGISIGALAFFLINAIRPPEIPLLPTLPIFVEYYSEYYGYKVYYYPYYLETYYETPYRFTLAAPARFTNDDRRDLFFTFLIVGLNEGTNANTVMVASYDGINREANLVSIPRDSLMNVSRNGRKISSSFMAGSLNGRGVQGGVAQMQREIMSVIGFVPDFYVVIDYDAFFAIIDAIGGIEIYVPFHMRYDDPLQNLHINIEQGLQHMDSETALHFSRFRMSNFGFQSITDYQRIENQQIVVDAVLDSLIRPINIVRVPEFVSIFNESVHTNLNVGNMLWFASQLNHLRGSDDLNSYTVPTLGTSGSPMWYEILDANGIISLVNDTVNPFKQDIELRDLSIITQ